MKNDPKNMQTCSLEGSWEPPVFSHGRPRWKIRNRIIGKSADPRARKKWSPSMPWQWTCPICQFELKGTYQGVSGARCYHVRSKHPEVNPSFFIKKFDEIVEASSLLPMEQRGWSCPLCDCGLPDLAVHPRNRAIKAHAEKCHPDVSVSTLRNLNQVGTSNPGSGQRQTQRRQTERETLHASHTIVKVDPVEKRRQDPNYRGFAYYCSTCFSQLRGVTGCKATMSCSDRLAEIETNGKVRSRKRAWWVNWSTNEPETAESFLAASGLTHEHMRDKLQIDNPSASSQRWHALRSEAGFKIGRLFRKPAPKMPPPCLTKVSAVERANWRQGGQRGIRVGEAAHPGPIEVWSLNTQGDTNAWAVLKMKESPDIWLLQETWFRENNARAFARSARERGYSAYFQHSQGQHGGVAVLVRRGIPQRFASKFDSSDSQGVFVWVQGLFIGSIYSPPHEHCSQGASSGFVEALISARVQDSHAWLIGGDFNEIPSDSLFQEVSESLGGCLATLGAPTRWKGSREIDWFCTHNCAVSKVWSPKIVISDHLILCTSAQVPSPRPTRGILPKGPIFLCPSDCSTDDWQENLSKSWAMAALQKGLDGIIADTQVSGQDKWDAFQEVLRNTFWDAAYQHRTQSRRLRFKGSVATVHVENTPAIGPKLPMKERKIRKKLARWHELGRLRTKHFTQGLSSEHSSEFRNLCFKLTGSHDIPTRPFILSTINHLETCLRQVEMTGKMKLLPVGNRECVAVPVMFPNGLKIRLRSIVHLSLTDMEL